MILISLCISAVFMIPRNMVCQYVHVYKHMYMYIIYVYICICTEREKARKWEKSKRETGVELSCNF